MIPVPGDAAKQLIVICFTDLIKHKQNTLLSYFKLHFGTSFGIDFQIGHPTIVFKNRF